MTEAFSEIPPCPSGWQETLGTAWYSAWMRQLDQHLHREAATYVLYPSKAERLYALELTPLAQVRVVILGQDPYHGPGQAHGLAFSVPPHVPAPPSLRNLLRELKDDLPPTQLHSACLVPWAQQGVLLLNTVLSVRAGQAHSHAMLGWEHFTHAILEAVLRQNPQCCLVLWGRQAQRRVEHLDASLRQQTFQLTAPHPSPLSAHRGFFGSRPFSAINQYLQTLRQPAIDWSLDEA